MENVTVRIGLRSQIRIGHGAATDPDGRRNTSIILGVETPWVNGTLHFPSCGDEDWRLWLADIGHDYLGGKLFGQETRLQSYHKTVSNLRGRINELRAEGEMTVERANDLRRDLGMHRYLCAATSDMARIVSLLDQVSHVPELAGDGVGGYVGHRVNPAYRAFCRHVLEPLGDRLRADYEREMLQLAVTEPEPEAIEPEPSGMGI
ncbi:hypothetical protein [Paracoccus sp. ME4]|uniref:hypothetical protein n=1 Tax=Paracoccus sp. ME4 TaxID=3138066 RepID=UPI00398B7AFA